MSSVVVFESSISERTSNLEIHTLCKKAQNISESRHKPQVRMLVKIARSTRVISLSNHQYMQAIKHISLASEFQIQRIDNATLSHFHQEKEKKRHLAIKLEVNGCSQYHPLHANTLSPTHHRPCDFVPSNVEPHT